MNQTGQAKNPFPLTRILLETQSWDSVNNWISGRLVLKLILIHAETPFSEVIFSFSTFGRFRCFSASIWSHSVTFVSFWCVSIHGHVILYAYQVDISPITHHHSFKRLRKQLKFNTLMSLFWLFWRCAMRFDMWFVSGRSRISSSSLWHGWRMLVFLLPKDEPGRFRLSSCQVGFLFL